MWEVRGKRWEKRLLWNKAKNQAWHRGHGTPGTPQKHRIHRTQVLIIGGGATGAGILWDLTLRGIDAVLVEAQELAYGTSGRCHGLLHSGGRYLVKDSEVARECYDENQILRRVAAAAVEDTGGLFVYLKGDDPDYAARWAAAAKEASLPYEEIDLAEARQMEPLLSSDVQRVFRVPDAAIDPFELILMNVRGAIERGAHLLTGTRVEKLLTDSKGVRGAVVKDMHSGESYSIEAEVVVNAAGPWAGQVAALAGINLEIAYGKGTLLVYSQRLNKCVINRLRPPGDADILVPAKSVSLLGTTDVCVQTPDNPRPSQEEINTLLKLGEELVPGLSSRRVVRAFAGVRPLYDPGESGRGASRGFAVIEHEKTHGVANFYSVVGGKLTTYRLMAERAADLVAAHLGVSAPCRTRDIVLPPPVDAYPQKGKDSSPLICECEMLSEKELLQAAEKLQPVTPEALVRNTRLAHGPCQGTSCLYRAALLLYREGFLSYEGSLEFLRYALAGRWRGMGAVLDDAQAKQLELAQGVYLETFGLETVENEL